MDTNYYKQNILVSILLYILTCGLYSLFWLYQIGSCLYEVNGKENKAGIDLILGIVTCGIYFLVVYYNYGKLASNYKSEKGLALSDNSILYLVLALLGFSIVNLIVMQLEINNDF